MKATVITTNYDAGQFWEETEADVSPTEECMRVVNLFPELQEQQIEGFGGAFTKASARGIFVRPLVAAGFYERQQGYEPRRPFTGRIQGNLGGILCAVYQII